MKWSLGCNSDRQGSGPSPPYIACGCVILAGPSVPIQHHLYLQLPPPRASPLTAVQTRDRTGIYSGFLKCQILLPDPVESVPPYSSTDPIQSVIRRNDRSQQRWGVSTAYVTCLSTQSSSAEARKTPRSPSLPPRVQEVDKIPAFTRG